MLLAPDLRPTHPACQTEATSGRRPSAHAPHCAPHLAAHQTSQRRTRPRRADASRCTNRLPSVRPRAAARPVRPRVRTPHCVSHPAPQPTPRRRAVPSPSTRSASHKGRRATPPHHHTPTERTGPRARLASPHKSHLYTFCKGGRSSLLGRRTPRREECTRTRGQRYRAWTVGVFVSI